MENKQFLSKESFSRIIETKVLSGLEYFDAVIEFCDENDCDPKDITKFIQPVLLQKLQSSAIKSGYYRPKVESVSIENDTLTSI